MMKPILAAALLASAFTGAAHAQQVFPATLTGHAQLPSSSFVPAPADASEHYNVSGRFTGEEGRIEQLYTNVQSTGLALPFPSQPLQGFSGIRSLGDGRFLVLTDNGFGSKANSSDVLLMFNIIKPDWNTGRVVIEKTVHLSDPNRKVPFPIMNEATPGRFLTGADFDLESIQPVGDSYWIGDEFGPWIIQVDNEGKVLQVLPTDPGGTLIRSPDNAFVRTPNPGATLPDDVVAPRSGGYEGMALSEDQTTLYPLLEKPLWDSNTNALETIDGAPC